MLNTLKRAHYSYASASCGFKFVDITSFAMDEAEPHSHQSAAADMPDQATAPGGLRTGCVLLVADNCCQNENAIDAKGGPNCCAVEATGAHFERRVEWSALAQQLLSVLDD
eukprot:SAG11_NODE_7245_length_1173_cov_1.768156_1_plen_111_part_00